VRGIYFDPDIGAPTDGTNTLVMIDIEAIDDGDDKQHIYGFRVGNLTGAAAFTENAIDIGTGWDVGMTTASPIVLTTAAGDIDIQGEGITNTVAGGGIDITATAATPNTATTFVDIIGATPVHTTISPGTDILLAISPTIGNSTGTTVNTHLVDLTFSTPTWGNGTNVVRGVYAAPSITNATAGTNTVAVFDIAAITADDLVNLYGLRIAALTSAAALTENAIDIGAGWDAGFDSASPIVLTGALGDIDVQGEDITNTAAGGGLDFTATPAAAGTATTFYDFVTAIPAHGTTSNDVVIELSPTFGIPTVANTMTFINSVFTLPTYGNAVQNDVRLWYIDPTIGAPTAGTNNLILMEVAAIGDLDEEQNFYGIRFGAMTQEGAGGQVAEAIVVGAGFDYGLNSDSPVKGTEYMIDDGDADLCMDSDNQTHASAKAQVPNFVDETADFLMTNLFTVVLPFAGGQAGEDTDGAGTNGGGMLGSTVDITTHDFNNSGAGDDDVLCKVYDSGVTTWDDLSTTIGFTDWAANYQLQADALAEAVGDAFAIGFDEPFCEVVFNDLGTVDAGQLATYALDSGKWQYSTATDAWTDLTVFDNTDLTAQDGKRPLQRTGAITFVPPANWGLATYDLEEAYWIQWTCTAAQITQPAKTDSTNKDEPIVAIPTTDSFQAPYNMSLAEVRVTNMGPIHNAAIEFIVGNFTDGEFSAVLTWTANQWNDWFDLAAEIPCDAGDIIGIMITDDNAAGANPFWMIEFQVTYED